MERLFTYTFHIPGTLTADLHIAFALPCACQLVHVSAVGSNQHDAVWQIGEPQQAGAYLPLQQVGRLGNPLVNRRTEFTGGQYPHLAQDSLLNIFVDYDGAEGTAVQNLTLALTFAHG